MKKSLILLVTLPTIIFARIKIIIKIPNETRNATIKMSGENIDLIEKVDKKAFGLTDQEVQKGIELLTGRFPDAWFFRSPTPWGDLYKRYNWDEVYKTIRPFKGRIVKNKKQNILLKKQDFINENKKKVSYTAAIQQTIEVDYVNKWSKPGNLNPGESMSYLIDFGEDENGPVAFEFNEYWGEETRSIRTVTVGTKSPVDIELLAGQSVNTVLMVSRWTMEIQIVFGSFLEGDLVCNYEQTLRDHHFWKYDINTVLSAMNVSRVIESNENIKVVYFTDAYIVVTDKKTNEKLFEDYVDIEYCMNVKSGVDLL